MVSQSKYRSKGFGLILYLVLVLGIVSTIGLIAYKVRQSGYDAAMVAVEDGNRATRKVQQAKIETAAVKLEEKKEKTRVIYRTITKEVDKVVLAYRDKPCLDDDGVRAANAALTGQAIAPPKPDKPLPTAQPVR